jgi:serine/threonine protein kinase
MQETVAHAIARQIMEHGEIDLSERLRSLKGGMDDNLLRVIWTQMLQAVDAIHRKRIIHGALPSFSCERSR